MMDKVYYAGEALHERFKDEGIFKKNECYDNTFRNLHYFDEVYVEIVFCWVQIEKDSNLYTRHACYLIDGEILDLTLYNVRKSFEGIRHTKYIPFKIFTIDEYIMALENEAKKDGTTGLLYTLFETCRESEIQMMEQGNFIL